MASVGILTLEMRLDNSHSLKDKRHLVRGLKDRLCSRYNIAVAEIGYQDLWQRGLLAAVTVASSRSVAEKTLQSVEQEASSILGPILVETTAEWIESV
jgi:uncharacterized protein YlxP (DUF503 family)